MLRVRGLKRAELAAVDLEVASGECVALMGPSGAGKSLLLRALVDLDPNDGDVSAFGHERAVMAAPDWRSTVAYVPAESGWWADRVGDHFEAAENLPPLLAELGLEEDTLGWQVSRLSTGERQRLALARALALAPQVLLLDEPTAALDDDSTARVEALIIDRLRNGVAVVIVTHDTAQADRLGARIVAMRDGRLETGAAPSP